jgi:CRISPR-associated endonuclease/helicase Cas3
MKTSFLLNDLKSHPNRLLKDHLFNVGQCCKNTLSTKKLNIEGIDSAILMDVAYLIGVTHDFGKATSFFQDYINEKDETKKIKLKNKPETYHGLISAVFTYYAIKEYLQTKNQSDKEYYKYLPIISFLVVKRHHGNLQNVDDEIIDFDEKDDEILERQIKSICFEKLNEIYKFLLSEINFNFDCNIVKKKILGSETFNIYDKLESQKYYEIDLSATKMDEEHTLLFYFITLLLYSILLDADKTDAAKLLDADKTDAANLEKIKRVDINENIVDEYKKLKFGGKEDKNKKINDMRNEIYEEVLSNVEFIDLDKNKILSLNVPTGTGKTLTALSFALKLRKRIESERGYKPRIIYSLPFLSIIDQNFAVFEDVFETVNKEKPTSDILLKHHHLSDVVYTRKEDEFEHVDKDIGKDLLLIEGWNSEIVITTFIQFFYSLISNRNKAIRKFHNIINSIVILDEVQAIPHKYWLLLNKTIKFFAEYFNTYFIFITATEPLIFDETKEEISPLVKNKREYFNCLNRVKLVVNLEPVCLDEFKKILKEDIEKNTDKDFLVVLNTINTSISIFDFTKGLQLKNTKLYYLSTNIIPKERLIRIKKIKEKSKKRKIIVSTQLIEAGVDIDVDIVYRDFAPIDSINQVSGRCNRNFRKEQGIVNLYILKEDKNGKIYYPRTIYDSFIIAKTEEVFREFNSKEIEEDKFLDLNKSYCEKICEGKSDDKSKKILVNVEKLEFKELSKFKLIEEDYSRVDVFVGLDKCAENIWDKYEKIISNNKLKGFKKKKRFLKIKKKFYDYVISIPINSQNLPPQVNGLYYIPNSQINDYYDKETGFKKNSEMQKW